MPSETGMIAVKGIKIVQGYALKIFHSKTTDYSKCLTDGQALLYQKQLTIKFKMYRNITVPLCF